MLLNFKVSNYRSFRDEVSLSMVATRLDPDVGLDVRTAQDDSTTSVLPVVAILGANASGKSNLLRAMARMRNLVLSSAARAPYESPEADYFRLDGTSESRPTMMAVDFVMDGARYQYGFELTRGQFTEEWLHTFPHKRTQILFDRERGSDFQFGKNLGGQNRVIAEITRPQVLFLSAAAQAGHPFLTEIYNYFLFKLESLDVADRGQADERLVRRLQNQRNRAVSLLSVADLGIMDAQVEKGTMSEAQEKRYRVMIGNSLSDDLVGPEREAVVDEVLAGLEQDEVIQLIHRSTKGGMTLPFEEESLGTKAWLSFVTYALEALELGGVLLVDELDASLHPLLIAEALRMFQSRKTNRHGAQLIFTTHDVTLLGNSFERIQLSRGQIWLTEKDNRGVSSLTPLSEYRPRKGEDLGRGYLQGRYGGTPRVIAGAASEVAAQIGSHG